MTTENHADKANLAVASFGATFARVPSLLLLLLPLLQARQALCQRGSKRLSTC